MSTFTHESMINHHGKGVLAQLADTVHVWRQRYEARRCPVVRPRSSRHRPVLGRCDLRSLKTVLAGLRQPSRRRLTGGRRQFLEDSRLLEIEGSVP